MRISARVSSSSTRLPLRSTAMNLTRREAMLLSLGAAVGLRCRAAAQEPRPWPPALRDAQNGTITLRTDRFLETPEAVRTAAAQDGAAPFTVARTAPTVDFAF